MQLFPGSCGTTLLGGQKSSKGEWKECLKNSIGQRVVPWVLFRGWTFQIHEKIWQVLDRSQKGRIFFSINKLNTRFERYIRKNKRQFSLGKKKLDIFHYMWFYDNKTFFFTFVRESFETFQLSPESLPGYNYQGAMKFWRQEIYFLNTEWLGFQVEKAVHGGLWS